MLAVNGFNALKDINRQFGDLKTVSQSEMYNLSRDLHELSTDILEKLRKMKNKTNELIALEASMIAVSAVSLASMAGKYY